MCADNTITQLKQQQVDLKEIVGISVTTFGVDGAPFDKNGQQLYPIISWKCPRTVPVMENLPQLLDIKPFINATALVNTVSTLYLNYFG